MYRAVGTLFIVTPQADPSELLCIRRQDVVLKTCDRLRETAAMEAPDNVSNVSLCPAFSILFVIKLLEDETFALATVI